MPRGMRPRYLHDLGNDCRVPGDFWTRSLRLKWVWVAWKPSVEVGPGWTVEGGDLCRPITLGYWDSLIFCSGIGPRRLTNRLSEGFHAMM